MELNIAIKKLDEIFYKYGIKDNKDELGYRNNLINYIKSLEGIDLSFEYKKNGLFKEFVDLQSSVGIEIDLLNQYTMEISSSNRKLGQDFTPNSLSELLRECIVEDEEYPIFYDCAGGTGSLVIKGYYKWVEKQKHFDDQFKAILEIDEYDIYNCYCCVLNCISRGLNAIIRNKNTLTNETYAIFIITNRATRGEMFSWYSDFKTITDERGIEEWKN